MLGGRKKADYLEAALVSHRLTELEHDFGRGCGSIELLLTPFDEYLIRYISK